MSTRCNFFVPGPVWVRPELLQEMTRPMISHRSDEFRAIFGAILDDLKQLFATRQTTLVMPATGTGAMQAALENCVARRVLVTTCGAFGERWYRIAESCGYEVDRLDAGWGKAVDAEALVDHLSRHQRAHYDAITFTHNETSTGITNDIATLVEVAREEAPDALIFVDAVSSLGGMPVQFDDWNLDVCLASVQKALGLPPGISVLALSDRALQRASRHPYRGTYFDFVAYEARARERRPPSTPSLPHIFALEAQLATILREETLPVRFARHEQMRTLTHQRTAAFASIAGDARFASATVSALRPALHPDEVRRRMKERGFILGGGYGEWAESTFRIGHMGDMTLADLELMLDALADAVRA